MTEEQLWLYTLCKKNGLAITDIQIARIALFHDLVLDWNKKINLVSRKSEDLIWRGHIALSLSILFKIQFPRNIKILDLGTGGGFPGIPLAILLPECSFTLLDSTQKKINAVQSMATSLGLHNVKTVWGRAEDLQQKPEYSNNFDAIVARSVSNLSNLLSWGVPFLKKTRGGNSSLDKISINTPSLITFKGAEIEAEESLARDKYPHIFLQSVPLIFPGSEEFQNLDKKIVIATHG